MCYDTPRRRAYFWWLMACVAGSFSFLSAAWSAAKAYGYLDEFSWFWHVTPLLIIAMAHVWFMGMTPDEEASAAVGSNCDPLMRRCALAVTWVVVGTAIAFFLVLLPVWFSPPTSEKDYVHGPPPLHAITTGVPEPRGWGQASPSPTFTPSQTPSSSPDPAIRRKEYYASVNQHSTVGGLYLISVVCTATGVLLDYNMRMVHEFDA